MKTAQAINDYFDQEINRNQADADYYIEKATGAMGFVYPKEKKQLEDRAWVSGVKMPAVLNDIRKDILKLI